MAVAHKTFDEKLRESRKYERVYGKWGDPTSVRKTWEVRGG